MRLRLCLILGAAFAVALPPSPTAADRLRPDRRASPFPDPSRSKTARPASATTGPSPRATRRRTFSWRAAASCVFARRRKSICRKTSSTNPGDATADSALMIALDRGAIEASYTPGQIFRRTAHARPAHPHLRPGPGRPEDPHQPEGRHLRRQPRGECALCHRHQPV